MQFPQQRRLTRAQRPPHQVEGDLGSAAKREGEETRPRLPSSRRSGSGPAKAQRGLLGAGENPCFIPGWEEEDGHGVTPQPAAIRAWERAGKAEERFFWL